MEDNYWCRAYTVYDAQFDNGEQKLPGGYILAAVFESGAQAETVLAPYRADPQRYDVRPSGTEAIRQVAIEIAGRTIRGRS